MPSMSISPPRLSTGTTARISNGPCRLTDCDADVVETSSRVNFLLYYYLPAIADGMKEVEFPFLPILL